MTQDNNSSPSLKKRSLVFVTVFLLCLAVLTGFMYYMPKFRQLFFNVENLRPAADENGEIAGDVFADVSGDHPNAMAITFLKSRGVIRGYEDGTFKPDDLITRGESMKLVVGALHVYPHHVRYRYCFKDVGDEWFAPYVCYAKDRGWVSGSDENRFYPDRNISAAEFLKIAVNVYDVYGLKEESPPDISAPWYGPYIDIAEAKGWIDFLKEQGNFNPEQELTRAQMAELLFRVSQTDIPV